MADEVEVGARAQVWKHEALLEWMEAKYEYNFAKATPLEIVTAFSVHRGEWRKSPEYEELVDTHREDVAEASAARRAARAEETGSEGKRGRPSKKAAAAKTPAKRGAKKAPAKTTATAKRGRATRATKADPFA